MNITDVNLLDKQVDEFELLNKVSRLSLVLLRGCSGGAYESQERVGFQQSYCACG